MFSYSSLRRLVEHLAQFGGREHQVWLPFEDTDFVDEERMRPVPVQKDIDVMCVGRLDPCKNLDLFASAVAELRTTYKRADLKAHLLTGSRVDTNWSGLTEMQKEELRKMTKAVGPLADVLHIEPVNVINTPEYYSRAKIVVLPSLCEGKNRAIHEAMACDTPVVTFSAFNQFVRGTSHIIYPGAGLYAEEFSPSSLARTIDKGLANLHVFRPREAFLKYSGRRHLVGAMLGAFPHYAERIPRILADGPFGSRWLEVAMTRQYGCSLYNHLYGRGIFSPCMQGLESIRSQFKALFRGFSKLSPEFKST
ncbi:MAG: glycosyltransferase family 1 protein [Cytophagaceae bacterium]|nr:MAG: glycosyltransferase family 1 protein [Cytophagaceae bacterium]